MLWKRSALPANQQQLRSLCDLKRTIWKAKTSGVSHKEKKISQHNGATIVSIVESSQEGPLTCICHTCIHTCHTYTYIWHKLFLDTLPGWGGGCPDVPCGTTLCFGLLVRKGLCFHSPISGPKAKAHTSAQIAVKKIRSLGQIPPKAFPQTPFRSLISATLLC